MNAKGRKEIDKLIEDTHPNWVTWYHWDKGKFVVDANYGQAVDFVQFLRGRFKNARLLEIIDLD